MPNIQITGELNESKAEYKGKPCPARAKLAFFNVGGNLTLELIEPDGNPSTWQEHLDEKGEGVHHIAFFIKDTEGKIKKMESLGMPLLQKGEYSGGRYAYFDAFDTLKLIVETLEND